MKHIPIIVLVVGLLIAAAGVLQVRTANAEELTALQKAQREEAVVQYGALIVATHAAAMAHNQEAFWDAATDISNASDTPMVTLLEIMQKAEWSYLAIEMWYERYGAIGVEELWTDISSTYAKQTSL